MRPFLVAGLGTLERKGFPVRWGEMEPISCSPCAESHVCMEGDKDCVLMSFREGMSPGGGWRECQCPMALVLAAMPFLGSVKPLLADSPAPWTVVC